MEASGTEDGCIFCAIAAGEMPAQIVDSDERTVAFMDINPGTRGHCLVIPRRHAADLSAVSGEDLEATMAAAKRLAGKMGPALGAEGFNVLTNQGAVAWQTVFHFHVHVIPRYEDDPLKLPWIPGPGDPDEIAEAAALIRGDGG